MLRHFTAFLIAAWCCAVPLFLHADAPLERLGRPRIFFEDFSATSDLAGWEFLDPAAWKLVEENGNRSLSQFQQSKVTNPVRAPFNRGVVRDLVVSDCVLDVRLKSTARDYPHRSLCLFFGVQDAAHLYYVHFGQRTDDHANQIFIVDGAPRRKISLKTTEGTPWDANWRRARIVREVESGQIDVFFDDMTSPAMTAVDKTFTWGQVGVGSFDDTGDFDDIAVYGTKIARPASPAAR